MIFLPFLIIKQDQNQGKIHLEHQENLMQKHCQLINVDVDIKFLSVLGKRCDLFLAFFYKPRWQNLKKDTFF